MKAAIMSDTQRQSWTRPVVLVGVMYPLVGVVFAWPSSHVRVWRLAAWLVSAAGYTAHIAYERFRLHSSPRRGALHVALAVALGAFGLAVAAIINSLVVASSPQHRRLLLIALVVWPIMTGLPAFLVALAVSAVLARLPWYARSE
jgi:hypothetical protein